MTTNGNKSKKAESQEVATKKDNAVAAFDYSQYANQGFESHTREDYAVPFLGVLQSNSPLCETSTARPGMLVNTVTQDVYDGKKGIIFIPVDRQHNFIEWKPREQGGGFVAQHAVDSDVVKKAKAEQEFGKYKMVKGQPASNDLIETFSVYGIYVGEGGAPEQMIISFSSTKIKTYKRWMTKARTIQVKLPNGHRQTPPLFAHKYRITSLAEKNAKGSFFNFHIDFDEGDAEKCRLPVDNALFQAAVDFFELLKGGTIKAAYDTQNTTTGAETTEEEIPFK